MKEKQRKKKQINKKSQKNLRWIAYTVLLIPYPCYCHCHCHWLWLFPNIIFYQLSAAHKYWLIRPLENRLSCSIRPSSVPPNSPPCIFSALRMRAAFLFSTKRRGGLPGSFCRISQHCETRVQFRRPKAASPPQELEVRAAGGRANF
jgi:hypothetical protein